jgi:hypothetical protein
MFVHKTALLSAITTALLASAACRLPSRLRLSVLAKASWISWRGRVTSNVAKATRPTTG